MAAILNAHQFKERILKGEVIAVVELARKCRWTTVGPVVQFIAPNGDIDSRTFDVIADGIALWNETQRNQKPPVLKLRKEDQ